MELSALWAEVEGGDEIDEEEEYRRSGKVLELHLAKPNIRATPPKSRPRGRNPRRAPLKPPAKAKPRKR